MRKYITYLKEQVEYWKNRVKDATNTRVRTWCQQQFEMFRDKLHKYNEENKR